MISPDDKLRLLANKPFDINGIKIVGKTIGEIADIGEEKRDQYLNVLLLNPKDTSQELDEKVTTYDILKACMLHSEDSFKKIIMESMWFFIDENVKFIYIPEKDTAFFYLNDILITPEMYEKIKEILMYENCITFEEVVNKEEHKESERAKELKAKIERMKSKVREIKKNKDMDLTLNDLVSSFVSYSKNIDIFNVWNMSIYQFYDQLKRMQIISDYKISIQSLLHGADPQKIDIKHFISKIDI